LSLFVSKLSFLSAKDYSFFSEFIRFQHLDIADAVLFLLIDLNEQQQGIE
jgi:hypothetical protein